LSKNSISSFDIHEKKIVEFDSFLEDSEKAKTIIITSGASCPDSIVEGVIRKVLALEGIDSPESI
jgi:4-hydroxy-3-methylbut-2-enyl diphosphate reductase